MQNDENLPIFSGATPRQIQSDLKSLVDFQKEGLPLEDLEEIIQQNLLPHLNRYDQPGFLSMFNTFPEKGAKLGAEIALEFNQGVTDWYVSPGGAMLEELCVKALCNLFGFGKNSSGTFMYSGTYANQLALYLALHWKAEQEGFDFAMEGLQGFKNPDRLIVLISEDAHFSLKHAIRMLGLGENNLFTLAVDNNRRIDVNKMEETIAELSKEHDIFCVVVTTGTTSTGSIDPVQSIARICEDINAWLHVDGAYGLAYALIPEQAKKFSGIEIADSVSWDPHKQFGTPIPNSLLFLKRKVDFRRMALRSDYIYREGEAVPSPGLKSPPSTRPMSALPLVTSIRFQGITKIIERLNSPLIAIEKLYDKLDDDSSIEVCNKPDTGIQCFRLKSEKIPEKRMNQFQKDIYDKVISEAKHSISYTKLGDKGVLRIVAISPTDVETLMKTNSYVKEVSRNITNGIDIK